MKEDNNMFFHGQGMTPIPTISALRVYFHKQTLGACRVTGLIKNILLSSFAYFFLNISICHADTIPPQVCHMGDCVSVEVVSKDEDLERGLMYRTGLGQDKGMLFAFTFDDTHQFWMKNMHFSLDILWISIDGHIVYIGQNIPACTGDPCPVYTPDKAARMSWNLTAVLPPPTTGRWGMGLI